MPGCRVPLCPADAGSSPSICLERRNALRLSRPTACRFRVTTDNSGAPAYGGAGRLYLNRTQRSPGVSERPDLDLAEPHDAAAVLKRDPPLGELGILGAVDGLDAVEDDGELRAFGGDVIGVPLVAGLGHRRYLGNIDDRAGAVARVGARIEDVDLIGICRRDLLGIGGADEDAAVGGGVDPELRPELEVAVFLLRNQEAVAEVGLPDAAFA